LPDALRKNGEFRRIRAGTGRASGRGLLILPGHLDPLRSAEGREHRSPGNDIAP
jgi:hypothetical protein